MPMDLKIKREEFLTKYAEGFPRPRRFEKYDLWHFAKPNQLTAEPGPTKSLHMVRFCDWKLVTLNTRENCITAHQRALAKAETEALWRMEVDEPMKDSKLSEMFEDSLG